MSQGSAWQLFLHVATCWRLCQAVSLTYSRPQDVNYTGVALTAKILHLAPGFKFTIAVDSHACAPPPENMLASCYTPIGNELSVRWSYTAVAIPSDFEDKARRRDVGAINVTLRQGRQPRLVVCPSCGNDCQIDSPTALDVTAKADGPPLLGNGRLALQPCGSSWSTGMEWSTRVTSTGYHTTEIALQASDGAALGNVLLSWQGVDLQSNLPTMMNTLKSLGLLHCAEEVSYHPDKVVEMCTRKTLDLQPIRASLDWYAFYKEPPITGVEVIVDATRMQRGANMSFSVMNKACSPTRPDSGQTGNVIGLARCFFGYNKQMRYQLSLASNTTFDTGDRLEVAVFQTWDTANLIQQKMRTASHTCPLCGGVCAFGEGRGHTLLKDFFPAPLNMPACGNLLNLSFRGEQDFPNPLRAPATWGDETRRSMVSGTDWEVAIKKRSGKVVALVRVRVIPGNILNKEQRFRFGDMYTNDLQPVSSHVEWEHFKKPNAHNQPYKFED